MESNEILYLIPSVPHSTYSGPDESSCIKWGLLAKLHPATETDRLKKKKKKTTLNY